jgi:hypothetical protein
VTDDELRNECAKWLDSIDSLRSVYGNVYPEYVEKLIALCRRMQAQGLREVAAQCQRGFITMAAPATLLETRAMGFEQLDIIEAWCLDKAKEREHG